MKRNKGLKNTFLAFGVSNYKRPDYFLEGPVKDLKRVQPAVARYGFNDIQVFKESQVTRVNILATCRRAVDVAQPGSWVVFYFSGHGYRVTQEVPGSAQRKIVQCLAPWDTDFTVPFTHLYTKDLRLALTPKPDSGVKVAAVLDACYSGNALRQVLLDKGPCCVRAIPGPDFTEEKNDDDMIPRSFSRSLETVEAGIMTFAACKDTQTAADTKYRRSAGGAFSFGWIDALAKGKPGKTSWLEIGKLTNVWLEKRDYDQDPVLSGPKPKMDEPIFG